MTKLPVHKNPFHTCVMRGCNKPAVHMVEGWGMKFYLCIGCYDAMDLDFNKALDKAYRSLND